MASQTEYQQQRPCCEWLIGVAEGRDIKITLPDGCKLMQGKVYGRGDLNPAGERITQSQLHARLIELAEREAWHTEQVGKCKHKLDMLHGSLVETRYQLGKYSNTPEVVNGMRDRADALEAKYNEAGEAFENAMEQLMLTRGAKQDAMYWIGTTPEGADPRLLGGAATLTTEPPAQNGHDADAFNHLVGDGLIMQAVD